MRYKKRFHGAKKRKFRTSRVSKYGSSRGGIRL